VRVFAEKGYDAASVDEIAAESGVSKGTIFMYFRRKDALVERVALASLPFSEVERVLRRSTTTLRTCFAMWGWPSSTSTGLRSSGPCLS